ncbi:MAG TPA: peroxiredoxin family protein [Pirellulales bacterium]|nr:peroxiredoxin family protein [Pirellulales bacterium]
MRTIVYRACGFCLVATASVWGAIVANAADDKALPPAVGDKADDFTLADLKGNKVSLSELTERGPVALVVLRGYVGGTCPFCTRQFSELIGAAKKFEKAGATVAVIYPGTALDLKTHAKQFIGAQRLPKSFRFLLDPDFQFANAYHVRSQAPGDTAYPASFVIDGDDVVRFAQVGRSAIDRASAATLLEALPDSK